MTEAFSKRLSEEQAALYIAGVQRIAMIMPLDEFLVAVVDQCEFWPTIATLNRIAGMSTTDHEHAAALEAWDSILQAIETHGVEMKPLYKQPAECGKCLSGYVYTNEGRCVKCECRRAQTIEAPKWDERIKFAVRSVGGFTAIHAVKPESFDHKRRAFIDAYLMAPKVEQVRENKRLTAAQYKQIVNKATSSVAERQGKDASSGS